AESIGSNDFLVGQAPIWLDAEADDAAHHRFCNIEIFLVGIETNLVREIDVVANDARSLLIEKHDIAVWSWLSCRGPPVQLTGRKGHPEAVLAIEEHVVRAREFDAIDLCEEFFD